MAKKVVDETSLTSIANAIREKTGASDALVFPTGMVEAIAGIETGGGVTFASGLIDIAEETKEITVTHNLGRVPQIIALIKTTQTTPESDTNTTNIVAIRGAGFIRTRGNSTVGSNNGGVYKTEYNPNLPSVSTDWESMFASETTLRFNCKLELTTYRKFGIGEYYWFAM